MTQILKLKNLSTGRGIRFEYFAYQDDMGKPSEGVKEAQAANVKISNLLMEKGQEAHPDKTCFLVFGGKKCKDQINE